MRRRRRRWVILILLIVVASISYRFRDEEAKYIHSFEDEIIQDLHWNVSRQSHKARLPDYNYLKGPTYERQVKSRLKTEARLGNSTRMNATFITLVRNSELDVLIESVEQMEAKFNHQFHYPWTFLNDQAFSRQFKTKIRSIIPRESEVQFLKIPKSHWLPPEWVNKDLIHASYQKQADEGTMYSKDMSYHQMCRWNSGFFFQHPDLAKYKYYWRVEPEVKYFCKIKYDPFRFLHETNKTYGFVINIYDDPHSVSSLWPTIQEFLLANPQYRHPYNSEQWLTDGSHQPHRKKVANGYSTCHFWSNFEIGDMDFWRSEAYTEFFRYLDETGNFFFERWGDAPVHSVGLGLLEDRSKIHFFDDIGYQHTAYINCPYNGDECEGCEPGVFTNERNLIGENCKPLWDKMFHTDL